MLERDMPKPDDVDPEKIARMITEDPNEVVPSDHFDDFEDEYKAYDYDEEEAGEEMHAWGDFMVSYLNTNKHVPADFTQDEDFPGSRPFVTMIYWEMFSDAPGGGHFHYRHPDYDEFIGSVWFDNGVWNYEWQTHA